VGPTGRIAPSGSGEQAYLARPASGTGPGVLVLHAWWGLTPFFREFCDRLSGAGFVVLAPDLYHGVTANTIEQAERLRGRLKRETVQGEITQAAQQLQVAAGAGHEMLGVVGFSLGGYYALWLAEQASCPVGATVVFYGSRAGNYSACRSALQFHLAESDPYVSVSGVRTMRKSLKQIGREAEFHTYPGTGHWFFESDRPEAYNATAAETALERMVRFLHTHTI
jgi:carboxymethylenebutenolidase